MIDSQVTVAFISTMGGIIIAYITARYRDYVVKRNQHRHPKNERIDTIFDGYENLIKQQQSDIDRKSKQLDATQIIIERLQYELDETREIVRKQQVELEDSKIANMNLVVQLNNMKKFYGRGKGTIA